MKKSLPFFISLLLFLSIFLPFSVADEGLDFKSTPVLTEEGLFFSDGTSPILDSLLVADTLYLLTSKALFAYNVGQEGLPIASYEYNTAPLAHTLEVDSLFTWQNSLYGLNRYKGLAYLFDLEKGTLGDKPSFAFPWGEIEEEARLDRLLSPQGVFGDELFILSIYQPLTQAMTQATLYGFNLTNGRQRRYQTPYLQTLFSGDGAELLACSEGPYPYYLPNRRI